MILRVSPADWLNELRTTDEPQGRGPAFKDEDCNCALTLALKMSGQPYLNYLHGVNYYPTSSAIIALVGHEAFLESTNTYLAFTRIYNWNDTLKMSFEQIANQFEEYYPDLIAQLQAEYDALPLSAKFTKAPQ